MRNTIVRICRPNDINTLSRLDLKTYPYPQDMQFWKAVTQDQDTQIILADVLHTSVGFAVWSISPELKESTVHKIGVLPKFRRKGLGRLLIDYCYNHSKDKCNKITMVVPHIHCKPGDADDVSVFLNKVDFFASGSILPDWRTMYGSKVDGYIFERKINDTP